MKGIEVFSLLDGLDERLLREAEELVVQAVESKAAVDKPRGGRFMPTGAVAACLVAVAIGIYVAVLAAGGRLGQFPFHPSGESHTNAVTETEPYTTTSPESQPTTETETTPDSEAETVPGSESETVQGGDVVVVETDPNVLWLDRDGTYPKEPSYIFANYQDLVDTGTYLIGSGLDFASGYSGITPSDTVLKYNQQTGEFSTACVDPYCDHMVELRLTRPLEDTCPFNCVGKMWFVWQNKLFYSRFYTRQVSTSGHAVFRYHSAVASYDLMTGAYDEVWWTDFDYTAENSQEQIQFPANNLPRVALYGDRMYFLEFTPIKENPSSMEDYSRSLVFIDLNTKKKTVVWHVDGALSQSDSLMFVYRKVCYFYDVTLGRVSTYDLTTGQYSVLIAGGERDESTIHVAQGFESKDYAEFRFGFGVCGDWLYFLTPEPYPDFYINRLNLVTGVRQRLSEANAWGFCMDDTYLYLPLWIAEYQKEEPYISWTQPVDAANPSLYSTVLRIRHDGSDPTPIGTIRQLTMLQRVGHWLRQQRNFFDLRDGRTYYLGVDEPILDPAAGKFGG